MGVSGLLATVSTKSITSWMASLSAMKQGRCSVRYRSWRACTSFLRRIVSRAFRMLISRPSIWMGFTT